MLIIVYYSSPWPAYISELANLHLITISLVYTNIFIQDNTIAKYILIKGAFLTG